MRATFDRVKTFSATRARERDELGEKVTEFLRTYPGAVVDTVVTQSSDNEFHCLTITLFCKDNPRRSRENGRSRDQDSASRSS